MGVHGEWWMNGDESHEPKTVVSFWGCSIWKAEENHSGFFQPPVHVEQRICQEWLALVINNPLCPRPLEETHLAPIHISMLGILEPDVHPARLAHFYLHRIMVNIETKGLIKIQIPCAHWIIETASCKIHYRLTCGSASTTPPQRIVPNRDDPVLVTFQTGLRCCLICLATLPLKERQKKQFFYQFKHGKHLVNFYSGSLEKLSISLLTRITNAKNRVPLLACWLPVTSAISSHLNHSGCLVSDVSVTTVLTSLS